MSGGHHAIPIKILHEAEGHIITVETSTGEIYRGKLQDAEDNMNIQMLNVTMTHRSGNTEQLQKIYIRGSEDWEEAAKVLVWAEDEDAAVHQVDVPVAMLV